MYDPPASRSWKATAQAHMVAALPPGFQPFQGPVRLDWVAVFTCPKGDFRKAGRARRRHAKKPDRDNVEKAIKDAGKGVLFRDDSQVCAGEGQKWIGAQGEAPGIVIVLEEIEEAAAIPQSAVEQPKLFGRDG
jgi:Holliday junction resolvase RusA-like endonuclease